MTINLQVPYVQSDEHGIHFRRRRFAVGLRIERRVIFRQHGPRWR